MEFDDYEKYQELRNKRLDKENDQVKDFFETQRHKYNHLVYVTPNIE